MNWKLLSGVLAVLVIGLLFGLAAMAISIPSHAERAQIVAERDVLKQSVALHRGLVLGLLSIEHNVVFPTGQMDKDGRYYLNHPLFAPIREALETGNPTDRVSLVLLENNDKAFMRITFREGYAIDMVYPEDEGFWNCVSHPNPASHFQTPQEALDWCSNPAGVSR